VRHQRRERHGELVSVGRGTGESRVAELGRTAMVVALAAAVEGPDGSAATGGQLPGAAGSGNIVFAVRDTAVAVAKGEGTVGGAGIRGVVGEVAAEWEGVGTAGSIAAGQRAQRPAVAVVELAMARRRPRLAVPLAALARRQPRCRRDRHRRSRTRRAELGRWGLPAIGPVSAPA